MILYSGNTEAERTFCASLGEILIRWNEIEASMRILLYKASGGTGDKLEVLIVHLGNVPLKHALNAVADAYDPTVSAHLKYCANLFEACWSYRNHFAHDLISLASTDGETVCISQDIKAKNGALHLHQGTVRQLDLDTFIDHEIALKKYVSDLILGLYDIPTSQSFDTVERPRLPDKLVLSSLHLMKMRQA